MWPLIIIIAIIVLYYIGKHENAKKANTPSTQTRTYATQTKRDKKYDAETKRLYKVIISDYKKWKNYEFFSGSLRASKLNSEYKKIIKKQIQQIEKMQENDPDGTRIRNYYHTYLNDRSHYENLGKRTSSRRTSTYSAPTYSQPTHSTIDYAKIKEEEKRQSRLNEINHMRDQISHLTRTGDVIEADKMKKKLKDFENSGF